MIRDIGLFSNSDGKKMIIPSRTKIQEYTFFMVIGFLLSRANILSTIDSFGYAWLTVLFASGHSTLWGMIGILAGKITVIDVSVVSTVSALGEIGIYVGAYVLLLTVKKLYKGSTHQIYVIFSLVFYAAAEAVLIILSEMTIYSMIYVAVNIIAIIASTYVFMSVSTMSEGINFSDMARSEVILFILTMALAVMGIGSIRIFNINIRTIIIYAVVFISAYSYGAGTGAFMGALFGILMGLNTEYNIMAVIPLTLCGLLCGIMKNVNKIISGLTMAVFYGALFLLMEYEIKDINLFFEVTAGAFLFVVFPGDILNKMQSAVFLSNVPLTSTRTYAEKVKLVCEDKIDEVCSATARMHKIIRSYLDGTEKCNNEQLDELMAEICDTVCVHCTMGNNCAFANNPKGKKNANCQVAQIMNRINYIGNNWRSKMRLYRSVPEIAVGCLYDSINSVKKSLVNSVEIDTVLTSQAESECLKVCRYVNSIAVMKGDNGYEVLAELKTLSMKNSYIELIKLKCEEVINAALEVSDISDGMISFAEKAKYMISTGVTLVSLDKDGICGDTSTVVPFGKEGFMIAVADGCGTGYTALHESDIAMELMETMAQCGSNEDSAISLINTLMGLRMDGDRYSTADICVLNKYNGNAKFIKMGAVCSFIIRSNKVLVVECGACPLGVQGDSTECVKNYKMKNGDIIVMMTDGVYDSCAGYKDPNEYFVDMLKNIKVTTAQDMADKIMDKVMQNAKKAKDDMLVFVAMVKSTR